MLPISPSTSSSSESWGGGGGGGGPARSNAAAGSSSRKDEKLWKKFEGKPPIPGFLTSVVVMFRETFELTRNTSTPGAFRIAEENSKIRQNFLANEICQYLLNNGLERLQILSNSNKTTSKMKAAELNELRRRLDAKVILEGVSGAQCQPSTSTRYIYDNFEVSIIVLTSCTGTWEQHRMYELVRDGYEMSSVGVIIIGDAELLAQCRFDTEWRKLVAFLTNPELSGIEIKDHLEIYCSKHQVINKDIILWEDLEEQAPEGGCMKICGEMECGHYCSKICHPWDPDHESPELKCRQPCNRICRYGHKCPRACYEGCGPCLKLVKLQTGCPHAPGMVTQVLCSQQNTVKYCELLVRKQMKCGHFVTALCSRDISYIRCEHRNSIKFVCGHTIKFSCHERWNHPMENLRCERPCGRTLKCGHICPKRCHAMDDPDHENSLCVHPCEKLCARDAHPCPLSGKHPCWEPCPQECEQAYDFAMDCGHRVEIKCSDPDPNQDGYFCQELCTLTNICGHQCTKLCGEHCGNCEVLVRKLNANCNMGHRSDYRCHEIPSTPCAVEVLPVGASPECGHIVHVQCHEARTVTVDDLAAICRAPCNELFDKDERECGHACQGTCGDCFQGRFHVRCNQACGKILICGHSCTNPCGMACPPCRYPCMKSCEHAKCEYECGVPCVRDCEQPCVYACEHSACSKMCLEVCDKPVCNEPCSEILKCGHPCVGFCGEECPKYCRFCSPEQLLIGSLSGDVDEDSKFIYLPNCGHCVESNDFEQWLKTGSNPDDEILPIRCPICMQRIFWIRRYSQIFDENMKLVNSVRERIFGNVEEIERVLAEVEHKIRIHKEEAGKELFLPEFEDYILYEIKKDRFAKPDLGEMQFQSMYLDKANFLNWLATEWINCSEIMVNFKGRLPGEEYQRLSKYWKDYMVYMIADRCWPLHKNEMIALYRERERMDDLVDLFSRMDTTGRCRQQAITHEAQRIFRDTEGWLRRNRPYTDSMRVVYRRNLTELDSVLKYTLNITERERRQIVLAFGEGSGRWFKCVNGHVYVVTECGGATEMGVCNECGAPIGGFNHVLVERNYLASEMDGAKQPLYPTVLNRTRP